MLKFKQNTLWLQALTHRSYLNEAKKPRLASNERLEFLGDAIISFLVSTWLYQKFPRLPEGKLTNLRSHLVKTPTLAYLAQKNALGQHIRLSRGEKEAGGEKNISILADTFEAVVGAFFLDQGLAKTKKWLLQELTPILTHVTQLASWQDAKSQLQEKLQAIRGVSPIYQTLQERGPDHNKEFTMGVYWQNKLLAQGLGKSKQLAEEAAAKAALEKKLSKL